MKNLIVKYGDKSLKSNLTITEPIVIGQHPPAGTRVPRGSAVDTASVVGVPSMESQTFKPLGSPELKARLEKWISLSISPALLKAQGKSWFYTITIQQLAHLDKRLIEYDQELARKSNVKQQERDNQAERFEHLGLSAMWVTMGFQVLFELNGHPKSKNLFPGLGKCLASAKKEFVRLRSPFTHNVPTEGDFPFPYQGGLIPGSAAWVVNNQKIISRLELADVLLNVLTRISKL